MNRLPANPLIARGLEIAAKHIGMWELCKRLNSPVGSIEAWRLGHTAMPEDKFRVLVDLLLEIDPNWADPKADSPSV